MIRKSKYFMCYTLIFLNSFLIILSFFLAAFSFNYLIDKNLKMFFLFSSLDILSVLSAYVIGLIANFLTNKILELKALKLIETILKDKITKINLSYFDEKNNSKYLSWITNDINNIKNNKLNTPFVIAKYSSRIFFIIIAFFYFSWIIGIITIVLSIISWKLSVILSKKYDSLDLNFSNINESYFTNLENNFNSVEPFYIFKKSHLINKEFKITFQKRKSDQLLYNKKSFKLETLISIVSLVPQFIVISVISILAYFEYAIYGSILSVGFMVGSFFSDSTSIASEISDFLKSKKVYKKHFEQKQNLFYDDDYKIEEINKIKVKGLTLKNEMNEILLKNFNFTFEKGKKYFIRGKSGSGKTQFIQTLLNFDTNAQCEIFYNNKNLKNIQQKQLGSFIEYIDSTNFIFNDTIINNLTIWEENPNTKKIMKIFKDLNIDYLDLQAIISNNDKQISEGEKQLLSLARAFYFDKKIWFLDEAINNIDPTRLNMIENLILNKKNTLIYVSHDLSHYTSTKFDHIIDLEAVNNV